MCMSTRISLITNFIIRVCSPDTWQAIAFLLSYVSFHNKQQFTLRLKWILLDLLVHLATRQRLGMVQFCGNFLIVESVRCWINSPRFLLRAGLLLPRLTSYFSDLYNVMNDIYFIIYSVGSWKLTMDSFDLLLHKENVTTYSFLWFCSVWCESILDKNISMKSL